MARQAKVQSSLTSGELDPELAAREDISFYHNGAQRLENVIPVPQGGARRRGGFASVGIYRGPLSELNISGATVTAPLGSGAANAIDGSEATEVTFGAATAPPEVIFTLDYGSVPSGNQVAFDVILARLSAAETQTWEIQYSTDNFAADTNTAGTITVDSTTAYSTRVASAPGANFGSPRYWRIRRTAGVSANAFAAEVKIYTEAATLGDVNEAPFTFSLDVEYAVVLTPGNADIYRDETDTWVASARIPHAEGEVETVTWAQSLDTMILFHQDVPPWRLFRLGSDTRWDWREQPFDKVQRFAWNDATVSGGVNEEQVIKTQSMASGNTYRLAVNGVYTADIIWSSTPSTNVTRITSALEALDEVTDVTVTNSAGDDYQVEFVGVDGNQPWPIMVPARTGGNFTIEVERIQRGQFPTAPLWDANHGYPRCGTFFQGRLYLAGFRDQPDLIAGSRVGFFFDLAIDVDTVEADDSPLQFRADSDEQVTIVQIHAGRHLQVLTTSGEFYFPTEPITPTNAGVKQTSRVGAKAGLPVVDVEGGTFFVERNGEGVREMLFVDTEQSYAAQAISLLSGHLIADPRSVALRRQVKKNDAALYLLANTGSDDDGIEAPFALIATLRGQQVTAPARWTTRFDKVRAVATTQKGSVWLAVRREINGVTHGLIEKLDPDYLLDAGRRIVNPDIDQFDAAEAQTVFTYTFTSPGASTGLTVWTRAANTAPWVKVDAADYTVDLGLKTVTFTAAPRATDADPVEVSINKRVTSVTLHASAAHLDGEPIQVMVDRYPIADKTPSSSTFSLTGNESDWEVHYGFGFDSIIRTMPVRGDIEIGPSYGKKVRIPQCSVQMRRTGDIEVGPVGFNITHLPGVYDSTGTPTVHIEAALTTGTKKIGGMKGWRVDANLEVRSKSNMDFNILGLAYRWVS